MTVAEEEFARKRQHPGPAGLNQLSRGPADLPSPTPKQRTVRSCEDLWSVERGTVVHDTTCCGLEPQTVSVSQKIANQVADPDQPMGIVCPAPQGNQEHPPVVYRNQVWTFPDVCGRNLGGNRIIIGQQRAELLPVAEIVATPQQHLRPAIAVPGPLYRVP